MLTTYEREKKIYSRNNQIKLIRKYRKSERAAERRCRVRESSQTYIAQRTQYIHFHRENYCFVCIKLDADSNTWIRERCENVPSADVLVLCAFVYLVVYTTISDLDYSFPPSQPPVSTSLPLAPVSWYFFFQLKIYSNKHIFTFLNIHLPILGHSQWRADSQYIILGTHTLTQTLFNGVFATCCISSMCIGGQ